MSGYKSAQSNADGRIFASYPMPPKIDLINEAPRRESLVEQQLENPVKTPKIEVQNASTSLEGYNHHETKTTTVTWGAVHDSQQLNQSWNQTQVQRSHLPQLHPQLGTEPLPQVQQKPNNQITTSQTITIVNQTHPIIGSKNLNKAAEFAAELAAKEAKLMADITAFNERPYSPFQTPDKKNLADEHRKTERQYQIAPLSRPQSRSSRCTSTDLIDKETKLLQEIEEMERKPFNPQTMVIEREQWYEYPQGQPQHRQMMDSKRRIKDFCSLPQSMYPENGLHTHEEHYASEGGRLLNSPSTIHTTIIRSPKREVDNKSPLPFAFDNFTTKGVRGNIASACAVEPDRPRAPIYPIMKRTPSPNVA